MSTPKIIAHARRALQHLLLAIAVIASISIAPAHADITDLNTAINVAGRERMLSQRIAKAYLQVAQGIDTERSARILDASVRLFDKQLTELTAFAPTPEILATYERLAQTWATYKEALTAGTPDQDGGARVLSLSEQVLTLAHEGTVQLERHAATTAGRLVNVSGRQRMLSQRMAKNYQAMVWGIGGEIVATELADARKEFVAGLEELEAAETTTEDIRRELELVRQQWFFFEQALDPRNGGSREHAVHVATTSERILETMEGIVSRYEQLQ
ncbi:MAG: type IV pili methyl-accepting chemotaxis transducer N-terminal domain-containing protein [Rhodocyclaceae bacterium]